MHRQDRRHSRPGKENRNLVISRAPDIEKVSPVVKN
jgi:hypothetical protein